MVKSLDKKWKELLFSFSGFGPNFLMVLMGAYFTDAVNPVALGTGTTASIYQAIIPGVCLIMPVVFPILWTIGKAFDGIIDIPFATITDRLSTKWGRRRPAIAVCALPMIISFAMCWFPVAGVSGDTISQIINTIWIFHWALVFFATYTMCLIAFYGSLSTTCSNESQRLRVSSYKSFFDTISYCIVYALVPVLISAIPCHIDTFVFCCLPLMLTITIPLFMIKEGAKWGYPENAGLQEKPVKIVESLKLTFGNRTFMSWVLVNACAYFGLQMFLVGMNAMIIGGMGFEGWEMTLVNTCAFAPVPIMLWLFNKVKKRKGIRFTYQTCLISFAIAILNFFFGSLFITGGVKWVQYLIGCVGGVLGSWAIGAFFMMPILVPPQISSVEEKLTGKNHSAMYFAAQSVTTSIAGAIASGLVYENIKQLFITRPHNDVVHIAWAENIEEAAAKIGLEVSQVFNLGTLLVPIIVCVFCIIGFILAFRMPKDFTPTLVAKELKKFNPELDISAVAEMEKNEVAEKGEIIFVQIALSILSGFIFGFVWLGVLIHYLRGLVGGSKGKAFGKYLLATFVPFAAIFVFLKEQEKLDKKAAEKGITLKNYKVLHIIFGILFPIAPINLVSLSLLQHNVNKLLNAPAPVPASTEDVAQAVAEDAAVE